MQVVVFASQKGGSGKTTLAGHLAVEAVRQMKGRADAGPVALIDTDPQGSLAKWWNVRKEPEPAFIQSVFSNLFHDLERARTEGYRLVFIDTPPAVTRAISEVVAHADLVVAPTRPSPHDLRAVAPTMEIVDARSKPLIFVVNGANPRARITSEAAIALSQHGTVAPTVVHSRVDFAASMIDGRTVMEVDPVCRSAQEIGSLWSYLDGRLQQLEGYRIGAAEDAAREPHNLFSGGGRVFGRRAIH
ncbi:MAG: ParA family protein [Pseudomonadota bacterium]